MRVCGCTQPLFRLKSVFAPGEVIAMSATAGEAGGFMDNVLARLTTETFSGGHLGTSLREEKGLSGSFRRVAPFLFLGRVKTRR